MHKGINSQAAWLIVTDAQPFTGFAHVQNNSRKTRGIDQVLRRKPIKIHRRYIDYWESEIQW
jgi:hypothetical protein